MSALWGRHDISWWACWTVTEDQSTMTYTYAILDVSQRTYDEIRAKLNAAGWQQAIHEYDADEVLDMHGIALRVDSQQVPGACV